LTGTSGEPHDRREELNRQDAKIAKIAKRIQRKYREKKENGKRMINRMPLL
jgi:hypothetical protein